MDLVGKHIKCTVREQFADTLNEHFAGPGQTKYFVFRNLEHHVSQATLLFLAVANLLYMYMISRRQDC